jgi:hypothetical protein
MTTFIMMIKVIIKKPTYINCPVFHESVIASFLRKIFPHLVVLHQLLNSLNINSFEFFLFLFDDLGIQNIAIQ